MVRAILVQRAQRARRKTHERGRPKKYLGGTLGVSFRVPASLRELGSTKAREHRTIFNLTEYMAMHYANFVERPIEESVSALETWKRQRGPEGEY